VGIVFYILDEFLLDLIGIFTKAGW